MDFADLMARYCDGDANAFRALYAGVAPQVFSYLAMSNPVRADDLLQLTFLRLHRFRRAYVRGGDPRPWIFEIARGVLARAALAESGGGDDE